MSFLKVTQMNENIGKAIFGSFDGMNCVLGVITAGYFVSDSRALFLTAAGLAVAGAVSMGGGSYLSEITSIHTIEHAVIIGFSSFFGVLLPVLPFLFLPKLIATCISACVMCLIAISIAQFRTQSGKWWISYVQTFSILFCATIASIVITLLLEKI